MMRPIVHKSGSGCRSTRFFVPLSSGLLMRIHSLSRSNSPRASSSTRAFIDSTNEKAPIAQRGHAKQKRVDLRLVGLGLVVTRDGAVPVVSHTYAGNRPDVTQFGDVVDELTTRYRRLVDGAGADAPTVVFDAGQNSAANFAHLTGTGLHFVGSIPPPNTQPCSPWPPRGAVGCEVLGLRLGDVRPGERRLFIAEGKGGHQRIVPVSQRFFTTLASYLAEERPEPAADDHVFVVLEGPRRGQPLSSAGLDEIVAGARGRAGIEHLTCHQLRHTCFTRLREAGMALEAIQAQAGHRSIESTRIYLHLANDWLAGEYRRACEAIDAQSLAGG